MNAEAHKRPYIIKVCYWVGLIICILFLMSYMQIL
jgi:hypothetical protein